MSAEQIKSALERLIHEYGYERGDLCEQYARDQLRDKILALLPEAIESVEWGVRLHGREAVMEMHTDDAPAGDWRDVGTILSRKVTVYRPVVTGWTEVAE